MSPHLGLVAHLEPTAHTIPHFLAHPPRVPTFFRLGVPIFPVILVSTNEVCLWCFKVQHSNLV